MFGPLGARPPFGGGINKILDKHPYIQYTRYIPDLTNDILFGKIPMNLEKYSYFVIMFYENIQGFWGYFVMVLNTIYIKGLSDMSVLYVFAGPLRRWPAAERSTQIILRHLLVIPLVR